LRDPHRCGTCPQRRASCRCTRRGERAGKNVILGGADSIEHGFFLSDEVLHMMKERGTMLVGTDFPSEHLVAGGQDTPEKAKALGNTIIERLRRAYRSA